MEDTSKKKNKASSSMSVKLCLHNRTKSEKHQHVVLENSTVLNMYTFKRMSRNTVLTLTAES